MNVSWQSGKKKLSHDNEIVMHKTQFLSPSLSFSLVSKIQLMIVGFWRRSNRQTNRDRTLDAIYDERGRSQQTYDREFLCELKLSIKSRLFAGKRTFLLQRTHWTDEKRPQAQNLYIFSLFRLHLKVWKRIDDKWCIWIGNFNRMYLSASCF